MTQAHYDTAIIGGGIIGLFTAWELANAGQSVCVLDRGEMGGEASWAAGGILSPLRPWNYPKLVNELALWSQPRYEAICAELQAQTGIDSEWRRSGMLIQDCPEVEQALAWARQHNQCIEQLDAAEVRARFPQLAPLQKRDMTSVFMPAVAQLRNPRLILALVKALEKLGVSLMPHQAAESVMIREQRVIGVSTSQSNISAGQVVVAAGAWTSQLLPHTGHSPVFRPVKGQMLLYPPTTGTPDAIIMRGDCYLITRADGRLVVGSSVEETGFDKSVTQATRASLQQFAEALLPQLATVEPERHWAGLRPATNDELPVIGPHKEIQGLYINAGHYRCGIGMAPAAAQRISVEMLGLSSQSAAV